VTGDRELHVRAGVGRAGVYLALEDLTDEQWIALLERLARVPLRKEGHELTPVYWTRDFAEAVALERARLAFESAQNDPRR